ncbi:hypothetical protein Moror_14405 [Moniliophthora roreri MCA 2997]|uniref:DUF6533 domain-containing protein n=1 Tax=Moniliophthora roreri (strain MCA 2997) TaxID=1381753 RepID=V2WQI7_MONRO|nr:hypothetical protein Moror_14405 [Moniliophthora roreri MCA 2997]
MNYNDDLQAEWDIQMSNYWCLFGVAILYWDHILTFPVEVKYLWKWPQGISGYVFFLHRYFAALSNAIVIISRLGPHSLLESSSCLHLQKIRDAVILVAQVIVLYLEMRRCHTHRDNRQAALAAVAWEAAFFYDTLIFLLAMYKAYQTKKELGMGLPLMNIVIRDGSLYFGAMSLASLGNILTFYLAGPFMRTGLSTAASSLSITLVSRMMLHLHEITDIGVQHFPTSEGQEIETRIQYYQTNVFLDDSFSRE